MSIFNSTRPVFSGAPMKKLLPVAAMAAALASPASAHHSTAAYDYTKQVTIQGTVQEFQWTNPHMFIKVRGGAAGKKAVLWNIECGTPNINVRHGWKKSDINPGDKLILLIAPMRDGSGGGTLYSAKLSDGRILYGPAVDVRAIGLPRS